MKGKAIKPLEDTMEEYINIFGILNKIQKAVAMKKKINKFNYVKITIIILPSSKDIIFKK